MPLLELAGQRADLWLIELSSFQTGDAGPLEWGVIISLYEEHLDWHRSRERYLAVKLKLAAALRQLWVYDWAVDLAGRHSGPSAPPLVWPSRRLECGPRFDPPQRPVGSPIARPTALGVHNALSAGTVLLALAALSMEQ